MANGKSRDDLFRQYLTRTLPDDELDALADRLLREPELSDELRDFEVEWIDARARGELSPAETAQVDSYLAQTGQQHRLAIARRFMSAQGRVVPLSRRRFSPYWLAAAAAVVFAIFSWQQSKQPSPRPSPETPPSSVPAAPFAILLTPGTRSAEPYRVTLPPGTSEVELKLALDAPLPPGSYQARLQSGSGDPILTRNVALAPDATSLSLILAAEALTPASYRVLLFPASNTEDLINAFSFEIVPSAQ